MIINMLKNILRLKITVFLIFFTNFSFAEPLSIKKVSIVGEKRISESFILNFLPNFPNTKFSDEILNKFTKDLYKTGLFSEVSLNIKKNILEVLIKEFPIINNVSFTGNDVLDDKQLNDIVMISPRDTLNLDNVNEAVEKIRTEYRKIGRYLAEVKPTKVNLGEGRVDLNFDITEGVLLTVKNINFVGNQNF